MKELDDIINVHIPENREALKVAPRRRIHTFIATSEIHVRDKLRKDYNQIRDMAVAAVKRATKYTDDVEFSCEDAGRTPLPELCRMVEAAIDAGATTINIPDTVGYTLPDEFGGIIRHLKNTVPNIDKAVLSVHCHNDLGMATANSLTAIQNGARQIECCMNGLGERAGNCSLEEVAAAIHLRREYLKGLRTGIHLEKIARPTSSRRSRTSPSPRTRRSWVRTPSRTAPAFTRTASSRTARPTRSSRPNPWASRGTSCT